VKDLQLDELEVAENDLCMVEISHDNSPFLMEIKKVEMKEEHCEFCRTRKMCRYFCICREVILYNKKIINRRGIVRNFAK